MSGDGSFLSIFVDDPRWELGAVLVGIAGLLWFHSGTPGQIDAFAYAAAAIALPGAVAFALAVADAAIASRLARSGLETRGRVTDIARLWPTRTYVLRYRFRDNLGVESGGRRFFSQTDALDWREGDEGPVRFEMGNSSRNVWLGMPSFDRLRMPPGAPAKPAAPSTTALPSQSKIFRRSRHRRYALVLLLAFAVSALLLAAVTAGAFRGGRDDDSSYVYLAAIVIGFLGVGLWQWRLGKREAAEGARILREGVQAAAVVMAIDQERVRGRMGISMSVGWVVLYSYSDGTGQAHDGKSGFLTEDEATRWRTGERCPVWYDPRKPGSSVWAG